MKSHMADKQRWDDLQAFLAIARSGRLTAAARSLGVEHTTLSRRLTRLESSLGTRLFDRRAVGYSLTLEGELTLPRAEAAERAAGAVWLGSIADGSDVTGTVRVGTPEAFGTFCLAERLGELAVTHPRLNIELVAMPRSFSLSRREADVAIGLSRPKLARLRAARLTDYELALYGSSAYLDKARVPARLDDLPDHRMIGYIDELVFAPELDYFAEALPGCKPTIKVSNVLTQMAAVQGGGGLCILPCFMADTNPGLVRVLTDEVAITRSYWLLSHVDATESRRIRVAIEFIQSCVKRDLRRFLPRSDTVPGR